VATRVLSDRRKKAARAPKAKVKAKLKISQKKKEELKGKVKEADLENGMTDLMKMVKKIESGMPIIMTAAPQVAATRERSVG